MPGLGPFDVSTQAGDPVAVGPVQLTPLVRVVQLRRLESVAAANQQRLAGFALVMATPVAVRVLDDQGERTVPIPNPTLMGLLGMLAGFVLIPVLSVLVVRLTARRPESTPPHPEEAPWN
jgi:hypothetical protein